MKPALKHLFYLLVVPVFALSCKDTNNNKKSESNSVDSTVTTPEPGVRHKKRLDPDKLTTRKYAGKYAYGYEEHPIEGEEGATGSIRLYPESDSTLIFSFNACKGAPSYNLGATEGRLFIREGKGYYKVSDGEFMDCQWEILFTETGLVISTINDKVECGFGHNVFADGTYARETSEVPLYFIGNQGDTTYFAKLLDEIK